MGSGAELKKCCASRQLSSSVSTDLRQPWCRTRRMCPCSAEHGGSRYCWGPGSIHVAHTSEERVAKKDLFQAVDLYADAVRRLQTA